MKATIHQINVNANGGVPKYSVDSARLQTRGVEGDKQNHRKFHGGPMRAVCLYSLELIEALRAEGHSIEPGSTGENLTISGLDWAEMKSGVVLQVGEARIELTKTASPCQQIAGSFVENEFKRIAQKTHRGWSRWYARVLVEVEVRLGDEVSILETAPD
ncbi:protein YiiM [Abditibacteriota bacterium]|nr:protein YiiM [Abditibacteriota bacterium]